MVHLKTIWNNKVRCAILFTHNFLLIYHENDTNGYMQRPQHKMGLFLKLLLLLLPSLNQVEKWKEKNIFYTYPETPQTCFCKNLKWSTIELHFGISFHLECADLRCC